MDSSAENVDGKYFRFAQAIEFHRYELGVSKINQFSLYFADGQKERVEAKDQ